jgi:uncharacterized protein (TIGR03118 family)
LIDQFTAGSTKQLPKFLLLSCSAWKQVVITSSLNTFTMYKINPTASKSLFFGLFAFLLFVTGCKKGMDPAPKKDASESLDASMKNAKNPKILHTFSQVNLVANNNEYGSSTRVDASLINAWGLTFSSGGTAWIGSQGGHVSDVYNSEGGVALPDVNIPSPGNPNGGGNPTGVVFNGTNSIFPIPNGLGNPAANPAARFIFVGVDGVVSAWNGSWGTHAYLKFATPGVNVYTGLTLGSYNNAIYLYAADFKTGHIKVWNSLWGEVNTMPFADPSIPAGYAPFNIQAIADKLYVTYAKVGPDGRSAAGLGFGYVNIFTTNGILVKRFASGETLNAPWGLAMTPAGIMTDEDDHSSEPAIVVGNFGDGHINVYRARDGKFLGQLGKKHKAPIVIEGLWALVFPPPTSPIDQHRLYFTAGPDNETDGLFGYIIKEEDDDDD